MIKIFRKFENEEIEQLEKIEKGAWVNAISPSDEEINGLASQLKVPADFIHSAMDDDEKPRYETEDDAKLFILRVPIMEDNTVITHPLSIIVTKDVVTTVHIKQLEVLEPFYTKKIKGFSTTKKTRFLLQILLRINKQFLKLLDNIEKEIDKAEKNLPRSLQNEEILRLLSVQKTLTYFSTAVISNHSILNLIIKGNIIRLFEEDRDILEDIIIENKQCIDMISIYGKILNNMLNASASIVSNNLNAVLKILASITIIMSIPTIITSFYGMNVGLPLQSHPLAAYFTLFVSFVFIFFMLIIFFRKKWI